MTLRGFPFLMKRRELCEVLNITRQTLTERLAKGAYPLLKWVDDCGTKKVVRPSLEKQLDAMAVKP